MALDSIRLQAAGLLLTITGGLFVGIPTLASPGPHEQLVCKSTGHVQLRCTTP